ncbi:MAG: hypothetical protein WED00_08870, partial [Aquisalimonadaceae bacterium]
ALYDGLSGLVVTIHESGRTGLQFIHEINAQGWSRVAEAVQALGLAIDGGVERIKTLAATGYDIYQTLLRDRQTRMLLLDFIAGWWESIADIDSMRGLVSVAVTVAVELLIALALAVTAVGAASAALNLARRIGGLSSNALQLLGRIYILLERMTRRLAAERPPAATNPAGHASADARRPQARTDQHQQADQEGGEGAGQSQNVVPNNLTTAERIAKLDLEGHAPIRHGGPNRVSDLQLEDRAVRGIDPASGTTFDAFNKFPDGSPKPHKVGRNATAFTSDDALLHADNFSRNSTQFQQNIATARTNGDIFADPVEVPLRDVFGNNYQDYVRGVTRLGSKNNPTGHIPINFTDGTIKAIYRLDQSGSASLHTLYPNPAP